MSVVLPAAPALWPDFLGPMPHPIPRHTAGGPRVLREVTLRMDQEYLIREWWRVNGGAMIAAGWELNEWNDKRRLQQWLMPDGTLTPVTRERLARLSAARQQQTLDIPEPELILAPLPAGLETNLRGYQVTPARQLFRAVENGRDEWGYPGAVDLSDMGTGKAQPIDQPVLTPSGWRKIGELQPGDIVFSGSGQRCTVTGVFPQGILPVYRVAMSDHTSTRCCGDHLWLVKSPNHRKRQQDGQVLKTSELIDDLKSDSGNHRWFIPICQSVDFDAAVQEIDPYLLGVLLGDGCLCGGSPKFSTADAELLRLVEMKIPKGMTVRKHKGYDYAIIGRKGIQNDLKQALMRLNLWGKHSWDKSIPSNYLFAGQWQRLALLQGLMDTDGSVSGAGAEFSTVSEELAKGVQFLVQSLGGTARISKRKTTYTYKQIKKEGRESFRVNITLHFPVFAMSRKAETVQGRQKYFARRAISSITPDGSAECVCIAVDHPSRTYLTDHCIVTHNTYMALAAALATGRGAVVLCPVVGRGGWERAFTHFGADPHFIGTYEGLRGGNRPHVVEQGSDGEFRWKNAGEIILILDEAQALRHDDTLNVKLCSAAIRQGIPIIVASATIAVTPVEMRFAGRITGLHKGADDWARFCVQHGCSRARSSDAWKWDGDHRHLARIHARLFPRRGCRVRKEELGSECPETDITVLPIHCGEEGRRIADMWEECERIFENVKRTRGNLAAEAERRTARMKAWQACELALVPHVAARAKEDARVGRSVALFVSFNETRTRLAAALNTKAGFYGGQTLRARQYYEAQFQANREFYLVSNIGAGGASVSLHDTTGDRPRSAYIFPTDHVVHMVQATGRIDRVGGQSKSLQWVPCVAGSLMERMVQSLRRKMLNIGTINDGVASRRF